jgi:uncharacterized repeat protein (TIGR01451 family)
VKKLSSKLKYLKHAPKSIFTTFMALVVIVSAALVPSVLFAWGPNRVPLYANNPPSYVTFNSIIDNNSRQNPTGFVATVDERNFMQIRDSNSYNYSYNNSVSITPGHQYIVYMYYHNDANSNLNLSATGSYVLATLPTPTIINNGSTNIALNGYFGASNAVNPQQVSDSVYFNNNSGSNITLSYIPGSATIHNRGSANGQTLSDNIITSGAPIGHDSLNGVIPSANITYNSYNYGAGYVTFTIQADQTQTNNFTVTKQANNTTTGATNWTKSQTANPGDTVNFQVTYTNNSYSQQNNIIVSDLLANGLTYIPNSTTVTSTYNQSTVTIGEGINTANGVNIGSYPYGTTVYVRYSAKVASNDNLPNCGSNTITSAAQVQVNGTSAQDTADITVNRTCAITPAPVTPAPTIIYQTITPTDKLPVTGPAENFISLLGFGAIVTALGYYLASRRKTVK